MSFILKEVIDGFGEYVYGVFETYDQAVKEKKCLEQKWEGFFSNSQYEISHTNNFH